METFDSNSTVNTPVHVSPRYLLERYWWIHDLFLKQYGWFDEPSKRKYSDFIHSLDQRKLQIKDSFQNFFHIIAQRTCSHLLRKEQTSSGTVAENRSVCRCLGTAATILSMSLRKPMSNKWSASSSTRTFTPISRVANPAVFSTWSLSRPGVATRICVHCKSIKSRQRQFSDRKYWASWWLNSRFQICPLEALYKLLERFMYLTWQGFACMRFCSTASLVPPITTWTPMEEWYLSNLLASAAAWLASSRVGHITRTRIGGRFWSRPAGGVFITTSMDGSWN